MAVRATSSFRLAPPRGNAVLAVLFTVVLIAVIGYANWVTITGHGAFADWAPPIFAVEAFFAAIMILALWLLRWFYLQAFSDSPLDYVDIGPEGLSVSGLFGARHRGWDEIERFTAQVVPARGAPLAWVTALPKSPAPGFWNRRRATLRVWLSGYVRISWFVDLGEQAGAIADWFNEIAAAYVKGNRSGTIPLPPQQFIGRLIER